MVHQTRPLGCPKTFRNQRVHEGVLGLSFNTCPSRILLLSVNSTAHHRTKQAPGLGARLGFSSLLSPFLSNVSGSVSAAHFGRMSHPSAALRLHDSCLVHAVTVFQEGSCVVSNLKLLVSPLYSPLPTQLQGQPCYSFSPFASLPGDTSDALVVRMRYELLAWPTRPTETTTCPSSHIV